MLKFVIFFLVLFSLQGKINDDVKMRAQNWYNIQQKLVHFYNQHSQIHHEKTPNDQEFFNIQQQLAALYFAQKRYHLGFGTALLPSECAVHNFVRKQTFLTLKLKELIPSYKKHANEYQKKYGKLETLNNQKQIISLEELNHLHLKFFNELKKTQKILITTTTEVILSINKWIKKQPIKIIDKPNILPNWIPPAAGIKLSPSQTVWIPIENAVVLCPDIGIVTAIGIFNDSVAVFIKQNHFTYIITGITQCCIAEGSRLKQGDIIGFCSTKNPKLIELQLWRDDILLDPTPYQKVVQL